MRNRNARQVAVTGLIVVAGFYGFTIMLQWIGNRELLLGAGRMIGLCTLAGLGLCLVGIVIGFAALKTTDKEQRRDALIAILVGSVVLIVFEGSVYLSMQSPNFRPVR